MGWSTQFCKCEGGSTQGNDYLCAVCRMLPPAPTAHLKVGDRVTYQQHYQRRTFWQWLTRQPRKLKLYEIKDKTP